jgi:hypothetical protein
MIGSAGIVMVSMGNPNDPGNINQAGGSRMRIKKVVRDLKMRTGPLRILFFTT